LVSRPWDAGSWWIGALVFWDSWLPIHSAAIGDIVLTFFGKNFQSPTRHQPRDEVRRHLLARRASLRFLLHDWALIEYPKQAFQSLP
jgi:hypothetical protein